MRFLFRGCLGLIAAFVLLLVGVFSLGFYQHSHTGVTTDFSQSAQVKSPPPPLKQPITLRIATFNIQDLMVVATNHVNRMREIGVYLAALDPDIIGFQESFVDKHRPVLIESLKEHTRLKHFQYFESASMGSGVFTASAFPIVQDEVYFHQYVASAPWHKIYEGDWFAGKGVGLVRVELPEGQGFVDFYNTHAQAGYGNPAYDVVREAQLVEMGNFMNATHAKNNPAFAVGDQNCRRGEPEYEALVSTANLVRVMNRDSGVDNLFAVNDPAYKLEVLETIQIPEKIEKDGEKFTLSDHDGWLSVIRITPVPVDPPAISQ